MECYFRVQRLPIPEVSRLPRHVFPAKWKHPSGAVTVTPWHKYVQSLLCKYGVNVEVAADCACACINHTSSQVRKLHACMPTETACESLQHFTLSRYIMHVHATHADTMRFQRPRPIMCSSAPTRRVELLMRV
jgi:hypothetical protein